VSVLGAVFAAVGVTALFLGLRRTSRVAGHVARLAPSGRRSLLRRWRPVQATLLDQSGLGLTADGLLSLKVVAALALALGGALLSLAVPVGPVAAAGFGYLGFVAPSLAVERLARQRRAAAERRFGAVLEWLEALVAAGRPAESALATLGAQRTGAPVLDDVLRRAAGAYALGAPLFGSLAHEARAAGLPTLVALAEELDRARDLGHGSLAVIRDARDAARSAERARSLDAAGRVEGRLMLVLVLCYMPALMLAVVIPLFLGLLDGLFG